MEKGREGIATQAIAELDVVGVPLAEFVAAMAQAPRQLTGHLPRFGFGAVWAARDLVFVGRAAAAARLGGGCGVWLVVRSRDCVVGGCAAA